MSDLIDRQAAIDTFLTELTKRERKNFLHTWSTVEVKYFVADMLEKLPSAQPVNIAKLQPNCNQVASDCISRQAMINEINLHVGILYDSPTLVESLKLLVWSLPSALPKLDEWCDDCKEYDQERHCCPRWNRVIRQTLDDVGQSRWIPVTERLPKPNEYENDVQVYYLVQNEYGDMMVCSWHGSYWTRMYRSTQVKDKVVAWMPLPTPYREGGQDSDVQRDT